MRRFEYFKEYVILTRDGHKSVMGHDGLCGDNVEIIDAFGTKAVLPHVS
jgi:hypothetical protein